ncbi:MAG TPA: MFS transporter, partial [Spirochaetia bacterium]
DIVVHVTIPEPPHAPSPSGRTLQGMLVPLRDRRFRPWLVFNACWNFSQGLGGSLCTLYFMENLAFKDNFIGGMIAVTELSLVGTFIAARKAGRMVDRFGIRRVLLMGYFFWSILPVLWLVATPRTAILWVGLASLVGGAFSGAANNAGIKLVTRFPPPEESGMYMAVSTVVGSSTQGLSAIVSGIVLAALGSWSVSVGGLVVTAFPLLFIVSFVLRVSTTLILIPRIKVTGSLPDEETPFLLPLFFDEIPGINRLARIQGQARDLFRRGSHREKGT